MWMKPGLKLAVLAMIFTAAVASAQPAAPDALIKSTVDSVLDGVKSAKDRRALADIIERRVLPNFDFREMTRMAMGRHWRDASTTQQQALENAFRALLVTTYTQALMQAGAADKQVDVRPAAVKPTDDDVTVKTLVRDGGAKPLAVDYRLAKGAGGWKVYDVAVENLSLVTNYRGTFNSEIGRGGIDGLIKSLEAKNRQNAEG
jgi:phospholipid transport system substrate-binding protein